MNLEIRITNYMTRTKISKIYFRTLNLCKTKSNGSLREKNNNKKEGKKNSSTKKRN